MTAVTLEAAVRDGAFRLHAVAGHAAQIEARALLLDCLEFDDYAELLAKRSEELPAAAALRFEKHLTARAGGKPIAYILGWREFYGHRFRTTPAALIPRPETECLVTAALHHLVGAESARVLDLGTGCGAIGISVALACPKALLFLTDVDRETLALAEQNAATHKADNVRFFQGDWYAAVVKAAPFDLIISNPPYVNDDDIHLQEGDVRFEPPLALRGGVDGLAALKRVIHEAPKYLRRGAVLMVEHGYDQAERVQDLFAVAGFCGIRRLTDLAGIERGILAVLP